MRFLTRVAAPVVVALAMFGLVGCAQIQTAHEALQKFTVADLEAATAIATARNHKAGMQCYPVLTKLVQEKRVGIEVKGAVSAFELAHVTLNGYDSEAEEAIHLACAPLVIEAQKTIVGLMLKFGITP